jgi:hypothetical protein
MPRILDFNFLESYRSINNLKPNLDPPDENVPAFMGGDFEDYPWLRVPGVRGKGGAALYVSCAMNGDKSAEPLMKWLATQPKARKFVIVTGRHGRECGNQLAAPGSHQLHDVAHDLGGVRDDAAALGRVASELHKEPDALGRVVSFNDPEVFPDGQSAIHLKAFAKARTDAGEDVIFNWCYSLSSMHDAVYTNDPSVLINQDIAFVDVPLAWYKPGYNWFRDEGHTETPPFPWRKTSVDGDTPPSSRLRTEEFEDLHDVTVGSLKEAAKRWLATMGVNKDSNLANTAKILLLGNPKLVQTPRGGYVLVSDVLNHRVPGMDEPKPRVGSNYNPQAEVLNVGMIAGTGMGDHPKYVHHLGVGFGFFNSLMGQVVDGDIHINAHMPGFSLAPWHEILHTFEGESLSASFLMNEGTVEVYSSLFAQEENGKSAPWYSPYKKYCQEVLKLASRVGTHDYAKAYFADDRAALRKVWEAFQLNQGNHKYQLSNETIAAVRKDVAWLKQPFV